MTPVLEVERVLRTRGDLGRGGFLRRLSGRADPELFRRPFGVAWAGEELVVTDPGAGLVHRITARRRMLTAPHGLFDSPIGVAACAAGLAVTDSKHGRLALLDSDLRLLGWLAEGLRRPTGVACRGGEIFVAETGRHRVLRFAPASRSEPTDDSGSWWMELSVDDPVRPADGWHLASLGSLGEAPGAFNHPTALAVQQDDLWVGDTLNFRVQRFDAATGSHLAGFGQLGDADGEMPRLKGIALDSEGILWISDAYLNKIALYDQEGTFLSVIGGLGSEPGRFSFPAGLAAHPDGPVAIVDSFNRRVQVLDLRPAAN